MKLSILDQSPISSNQTPQEALEATMKLAERAEKLGYTRFWIAEHHALPGLASSVPEVMLSYIGANTNSIRIGSGAVLLPYYKPYKVAETYNMLATLFPGRVDIGVGRAPGGSAEASAALSDNFLQSVFKMPELLKDLINYVDDKDEQVKAAPLPPVRPEIWMLGTSEKSARAAAENGLAYAFGQFMSDTEAESVVEQYRKAFKPRYEGQQPYVILTVSIICAETTEKAETLADSYLVWQVKNDQGNNFRGIPSLKEAEGVELSPEEQKKIDDMKNQMIIGNPDIVRNELNRIQEDTDTDEFMIVTITYSPEDKQNSYRLIAEQFQLQKSKK
ncbi:LLM class flavin-dependent oxidoreductase [Salinicoccus sp. HZC-1]|uniref:LLM class flavin-dependent oxidoreductase n=1 Tax=Salinicoccus sp. HZC-1 TaxID=3385497 RepID=UPI00398AFBD5